MKIAEMIRRKVKEAIADFDFSEMVEAALEEINIAYLVEKKIEESLDIKPIVEELVEEIIDDEVDFLDVDDIVDSEV